MAVVGQLYARGLLPQLLAFALFFLMQRFLQAQNIVNPVAYITLVVLIFHTLSHLCSTEASSPQSADTELLLVIGACLWC